MAQIYPDQLSLEIAHKQLGLLLSYLEALRHPTYRKLIETRARTCANGRNAT